MRLAVFDLDFTVWQPEMYHLYGTPKLVPVDSYKFSDEEISESQTREDGHLLSDRGRIPIRIFPGARQALSEIQKMPQVEAAVASKTDEPRWAKVCMEELVIDEVKTTLADCFGDRIEISYGSKVNHLKRLQRKTGVAFADMCFFDNEQGNIRDVSGALPDVKCYYTPDGMTQQAWEQAKSDLVCRDI
mmetsp:Transcript_12249/g.33970  ORF Transcript_12249/g.33970 Transcript_12249/m.33970 type:complete len:188 (-) Transcript_12249:113-676(-)